MSIVLVIICISEEFDCRIETLSLYRKLLTLDFTWWNEPPFKRMNFTVESDTKIQLLHEILFISTKCIHQRNSYYILFTFIFIWNVHFLFSFTSLFAFGTINCSSSSFWLDRIWWAYFYSNKMIYHLPLGLVLNIILIKKSIYFGHDINYNLCNQATK